MNFQWKFSIRIVSSWQSNLVSFEPAWRVDSVALIRLFGLSFYVEEINRQTRKFKRKVVLTKKSSKLELLTNYSLWWPWTTLFKSNNLLKLLILGKYEIISDHMYDALGSNKPKTSQWRKCFKGNSTWWFSSKQFVKFLAA